MLTATQKSTCHNPRSLPCATTKTRCNQINKQKTWHFMVTLTSSSVSAERGPQVDLKLKAAFPLGLYAFAAAAVVQLLSHVRLFAAPWTAARQASLSFTISQSLLKLKFLELVMPSKHLIFCRPLLLPSIFPSIRVFTNESAVHIRRPKNWSFSISPSNE